MAGPLRHAQAIPLRKRGLPAWFSWPAVALLTGASLFLGFFDLTKRSLWLDEGYTWITVIQPVKAIVAIAHQQGYHLLPYYLLLHALISQFGDSAFVMRAPSVVAGAATVPLMYLLVSRLGGRLAGLFASVLFVVSEPLVFWQQNARDYAFVVLFSVGSCLAAVVAVQEERFWMWLVWVVVSGLGCYTHPEMLLLLPPQIVVILAWARSWRTRWTLIGFTGAGALAALPILGEAAHSSVYQVTPLVPPNYGSATEIATFLASAAGTSAPVTAVNHALLGLTFAMVVLGVALLGADLVERGCTWENLGLGLSISWLVVPPILSWLASETGHPDFLDRYLILSLPATSAVMALVLARVRPRTVGVFGLAYLAIFRGGLVVQSYHWPLDDYRAATRTVVSAARPHDCITFSSNEGRALYDYYSARMVRASHGRFLAPVQILPYAFNGGPSVVLTFNNLTDGQIAGAQTVQQVAVSTYYCQRMWLFQSHAGAPKGSPDSEYLYASLEALRANLLHYYRPVEGVPFPGVGVFLYDRITTPPGA